MIIDTVSDLHGFYPYLEGGDLLIVAGDLTARDTVVDHGQFKIWLFKQEYKKKIVIAGNHDNHFMGLSSDKFVFSSYNVIANEQKSFADYLCDSGTEFQGLKIWGSPWTKTFKGMNPHCMAFTYDTEGELDGKFSLIPDDIDILISHSPIYGVLDGIPSEDGSLFHVGSKSLRKIMRRVRPKLWICGHIHEGYGEFRGNTLSGEEYHIVNASHVNEHYQPVNKPIRIEL